MAGEGGVAHPAEARVSTGNASLDSMLEGGLVAHRPYLIVGPSGTGKTTLALQFLCEGVRRKERVLLVTLEEPPNEIRVNHRGLEPPLSRVEVFDAIPDIMRYERTPFKDIASVRTAIPFAQVPPRIRQSPELASVEVTITALEQMLRTEVIRKGYTRLVLDSLTALQYFCMKGFDPVGGAQSLLRFLSDLRVTTLITVEAPLEDVETPERMLARGEIRLFRWELDGGTVRAVGVEKFRGSSHDVRLHPYRIGPQGIDINLDVTISRDTRQIIEPIVPRIAATVALGPPLPVPSPVTPLMDEVRDLILIGADVGPARSEIAAALAATIDGRPDQTQAHLSRVSSLVIGLVDHVARSSSASSADPIVQAALQRLLARADSVRAGVPPTSLPPASALQVQLGALLSLLPLPATAPPPIVVPATLPVAPAEATPSAPVPVAVPPEPVAPAAEPAPAPPPEGAPAPAPVAEAGPPEEPPARVEIEQPQETLVPAQAEPPQMEESAPAVVPPPESIPAAPASEPAPAGVPPEPETPADRAALTPAQPPPEVVPPPAEPVPPAPEPEPPPPVRMTRRLPAPPKPHPPMGVGTSRSAPEPAARTRTTKAGPPPLPSTTAPAWPAAAAAPSRTTPPAHAAVRPSAPHPAAAPSPTRPSAATASKKRRRVATAPTPKRAGGHAKPPVVHVPEPKSPPPAVVAVPPPPPPIPAEPRASVAPPIRVRRRSPRKRKAPPVVSASVEPVPPGALMEPPEPPKSPDDPEGHAREEG